MSSSFLLVLSLILSGLWFFSCLRASSQPKKRTWEKTNLQLPSAKRYHPDKQKKCLHGNYSTAPLAFSAALAVQLSHFCCVVLRTSSKRFKRLMSFLSWRVAKEVVFKSESKQKKFSWDRCMVFSVSVTCFLVFFTFFSNFSGLIWIMIYFLTVGFPGALWCETCSTYSFHVVKKGLSPRSPMTEESEKCWGLSLKET